MPCSRGPRGPLGRKVLVAGALLAAALAGPADARPRAAVGGMVGAARGKGDRAERLGAGLQSQLHR